MAILDWPEDDSDEDSSSSGSSGRKRLRKKFSLNVDFTHFRCFLAPCSRSGCRKSRAQNPRTGELHQYCSLKCQYLDSGIEGEEGSTGRRYNVDLMIALQMSRLQLLQDLRMLSYGQ